MVAGGEGCTDVLGLGEACTDGLGLGEGCTVILTLKDGSIGTVTSGAVIVVLAAGDGCTGTVVGRGVGDKVETLTVFVGMTTDVCALCVEVEEGDVELEVTHCRLVKMVTFCARE